MAIYKLIANGSFGPDEIKVMTEAYENGLVDIGQSQFALIDLGIANRDDPVTELIAKSIVNVSHRRTQPDPSKRARCQRTGTPQDQCGLKPQS
jgi:hypothetical protein